MDPDMEDTKHKKARDMLQKSLLLLDRNLDGLTKKKHHSHDDILDITRITTALFRQVSDDEKVEELQRKGLAQLSDEELNHHIDALVEERIKAKETHNGKDE